MTINPETYARFRDTIELFRSSPPRRPANVSDDVKNELELR